METVLALLGNLLQKREHSFPSELRALIEIYETGQELLTSERYSVSQIMEELKRDRNYVLR